MARDRVLADRVMRISAALELLALFGLLSAAGALASYLVAIHSTGYVDDSLATIGPMLGFRWPEAYAFIATHPAAIVIGRIGYLSIFWMPFVLMTTFGLTGRDDWGRTFLLGFTFALVFTMVLFFMFPAKGRSAILARARTICPFPASTRSLSSKR